MALARASSYHLTTQNRRSTVKFLTGPDLPNLWSRPLTSMNSEKLSQASPSPSLSSVMKPEGDDGVGPLSPKSVSESSSRKWWSAEKVEAIKEACRAGNRKAVVELATSRDGLISDEIRAEACVYFDLFLSFTVC